MQYKNIILLFVILFSLLFAKGQNQSDSPNKNLPLISEINFVGFNNESDDILKMFRDNRLKFSRGAEYKAEQVEKALNLTQKFLLSEGYLDAMVKISLERVRENEIRLVFSVNLGEKIKVSEIQFVGNRLFSNQELVENFKQCTKGNWEVFERSKYEYYSRKCSRGYMFRRGYITAAIQKINWQRNANSLTVNIEVKEGHRYRLGDIKIEGSKLFSGEQILEMLKQKTGQIVNGEALQKFIFEDLKQIYDEYGYLQCEGDIEPEIIKSQNDEDGIVNLKITIFEGDQFKLGEIRFSGIKETETKKLKQILAVKENEVFNKKLFEKGIEKINNSEKFQLIDKDKDIDFRTDEERGKINIVIKVKKSD